MTTPLPMGIVYGMDAERYHADPSVSNTMLSAMAKSPAHCYALHLDPQRPPNKPTAAMSAGTLAHTAILEPDELLTRYVVRPDGMKFTTKDGQSWRDQQTLPMIGSDDLATAQAQRAAVMRVGELRRLFSSGVSEVSLFWNDEATGLRCRARPDWLHFVTPTRVVALDVKTIADLTPDSVERAVTSYGYHRQRAHYVNGLKACGLQVEEFGFAFVSGSYPFLAAAYTLDDDTIAQGEDEVSELLERFADCKERNDWPAFGDGFQLSGLGKWARRNNEIEVGWAE